MYPPTIRRILHRDWWSCMMLWWGIVVPWIAAGIVRALGYLERDQDGRVLPTILGLACSATLAALLVIACRANQIRRAFAAGKVVTGRVARTGDLFEGEEPPGYAAVTYEFEGRRYQVKVVEGHTARCNILQEGDATELVVDPYKPSRAFIVSLFD